MLVSEAQQLTHAGWGLVLVGLELHTYPTPYTVARVRNNSAEALTVSCTI